METAIAPEDQILLPKLTEYLGFTIEDLESPVPSDDYGLNWPDGLPQYFKDAVGYKAGGIDGHSAFYHLIQMIRLDLPHVELHCNGYINTTFLRVVNEYTIESDLAIAGAASSGKTYPVAVCILEDWKAAPHETLSFVCTTSLGAAEDRIWGAIVGNHGKSLYQVGTYIAHKYVIAWDNLSDEASDREYNCAIKAVAIPTGEEGRKAIATLRGRKNKRVRIAYDELPEMERFATNANINLESNPNFRAAYIGNPNRHDDAHGEICKPDHLRGFKSIDRTCEKWLTRTGACIFMNGEWSPNFQAPVGTPIPFPYLANRNGLKQILRRCHGNRNSIEYYRNAVGFWPDSSISDTVLSLEILEAKEATKRKKWKDMNRKKVAGFDTGFTHGGDDCVVEIGEVGMTNENRRVLQHKKEYVIIPPATGLFEEEIAKQVVDILRLEGVEPENFGMDISSDGGKIYREIVRYWLSLGKRTAANCHAISSMGKPSERLVSNVDIRKCSDAYDRRVTEYWMMIREGVMTQCIMGIPFVEGEDNELVNELCARLYEIIGKKFSIETKKDMKLRLKHSPDRADAFSYMVEMARRLGLTFTSPDDEERRDERKRERKENVDYDEFQGYEDDSWGEDEDAA